MKLSKVKLPKQLLKYIQPADRAHEFDLWVIWRIYLKCMRDPEYDDESRFEYMKSVLGDTFKIPVEHWHRFIPDLKKREPSPAELARQIQKLLNPVPRTKVKRPKPLKIQSAPVPMIQRTFKPKLIVRRDGHEIKRA